MALHKNKTFIIHDTNRYFTDDYAINLALQETTNGYSIGIYVTCYKVGLGGYQQYWHYKSGEKNLAQKAYKQVYAKVDKTVKEFEFENIPMAILKPRLRARLDFLDDEHKERSGVYNHNWFVELVEKEPDWRQSIYGHRYPDPPTSFETIGELWNTNKDEQSSAITTTGKGRSQVSSYKYAELNKEAQLQLLKKWFPTVGMAALMSFLAATNLSAPELEQKLQENPEEVRAQIPETEPDYTFPGKEEIFPEKENIQPEPEPEPEQSHFNSVLPTTLDFEGGYSNHPKDPGKETYKGITRATYEEWAQEQGIDISNINMRQLPQEHIEAIYKEKYWDKIGGDSLPPLVAQQVFDYAVHSGVFKATTILQHIVGSPSDGKFGPNTLAATQKYVQQHGELKLAQTILSSRTKWLDALGRTEKFQDFHKGWMNRMADLKQLLEGEEPKGMAILPSTQKKREKHPPEKQTRDIWSPQADWAADLGTLVS